MSWNPETLAADFVTVAKLAGVDLPPEAINIEKLPAPHRPPTRLPQGQMAVYVFAREGQALKVGKVGAKSQARYTSQHYNPGSAMSTLAASILADRSRHALSDADAETIGVWIRAKIDRFNFLIDEAYGMRVLTLLEAFLQCRLDPLYEGFQSQNRRSG